MKYLYFLSDPKLDKGGMRSKGKKLLGDEKQLPSVV